MAIQVPLAHRPLPSRLIYPLPTSLTGPLARWVAADNAIYLSTDAGETWSERRGPAADATSISAIGPRTAWLRGYEGPRVRLYRTLSAGRRWRELQPAS
jgi:photosystem II stability/assembly factor-like uncharacterized protein